MKRILIGVVSALLLIACSGIALAEEGRGVEAGFQMWVNDWTHDVPTRIVGGVLRPGGSTTSDAAVLFGPAIEAKFPNHVFVDASYLFSLADYTFTDVIGNLNDERQETNGAIGYMIVPEFGLLAGYKNSAFREKETGIKNTLYGPFIGMIAIAPMYVNSSFYGKLDYLFTRFKQQGGGIDGFQEDSPGWALEFGFKVGFTREFTGTFGYRYETNTGNVSGVQDSFSGLVFDALFAL